MHENFACYAPCTLSVNNGSQQAILHDKSHEFSLDGLSDLSAVYSSKKDRSMNVRTAFDVALEDDLLMRLMRQLCGSGSSLSFFRIDRHEYRKSSGFL